MIPQRSLQARISQHIGLLARTATCPHGIGRAQGLQVDHVPLLRNDQHREVLLKASPSAHAGT